MNKRQGLLCEYKKALHLIDQAKDFEKSKV